MLANPETGMPHLHGSQFFDCLFHVKYLKTSVYIIVFANRPATSSRLQRLKNSIRVVFGAVKACHSAVYSVK